MAHIPKERRLKWDRKAEQYILVGFSENVKGYRIYDPRKNTVSVKRDVIVMEGKTNMSNTENENTIWIQEKNENLVQHQIEPEADVDNRDSVGESTVNESLDNSSSSSASIYSDSESKDDITMTDSNIETEISASELQETGNVVEGKRNWSKPERYGYNNMCVSSTTPEAEQIVFSEALNGPEAEKWKMAMREELQSFKDNDAWELVDVPDGASIVKCGC